MKFFIYFPFPDPADNWDFEPDDPPDQDPD